MTKKTAKKETTTTGSFEPNEVKMTWKMVEDPPDEPEDHGKVFSEIPFQYRWRFAIYSLPDREPTVTIYGDAWHNGQRKWAQQDASSYSLSTLKRLMVLLDEKLEKDD